VLTTHRLLVPRSRKSRAIPLPPRWAFGSVTRYLYLFLRLKIYSFLHRSFKCLRIYYYYYYYIYIYIYIYKVVNWRDFVQCTGWGREHRFFAQIIGNHPCLLTYKVACSPPPIKVTGSHRIRLDFETFLPSFGVHVQIFLSIASEHYGHNCLGSSCLTWRRDYLCPVSGEV
jgi:hypothetical protein